MIRPGKGYLPPVAIPPGETIREVLEEKYITQAELAQRLGMTTKHVNEIINGKAPITVETAVKMEDILGLPCSYWLNLEAIFQETKIRLREQANKEDEVNIARAIPYNQMAQLGWVPVTRKAAERITNLRKYFEIPSLQLIPEVYSAAFRVAQEDKAIPFALAAWLQWGKVHSREIKTEPFSRKLLCDSIPFFRNLTTLPANEFVSILKERCSQCGIALVFAPHLDGTYAHGATEWLSSDKVMILLSLRYKYADIFWFSFFHEIAHVLNHNKKPIYINSQSNKNQIEQEADRLAAELLLPQKDYSKFVAETQVFSIDAVKSFAEEQGLDPCIIIGRLQRDGHIHYSELTELKRRFDWMRQ
ncbi:MAG: HigA family addiction module antitoxin [Desulfitobacteriaceae bacterium]|jgi:HTH-type transcriptional regulator/antitoxin HigA|nr:HigA family addiction module antitoxin [Desulfitobacteriaceae bacterium]